VGTIAPEAGNTIKNALLGLARVNAQEVLDPGVIKVGAESAVALGLDPLINFLPAEERAAALEAQQTSPAAVRGHDVNLDRDFRVGFEHGGTTDTVPAMLTPGEGVIPVENMVELMSAGTPNEQVKVARDLQQIMATRDGDPIEGAGTGFAAGGSALMEFFARLLGQNPPEAEEIIDFGEFTRDPVTGRPSFQERDPARNFPQPPPGIENLNLPPRPTSVGPVSQPGDLIPALRESRPIGSDRVFTASDAEIDSTNLDALSATGTTPSDEIAQVKDFIRQNQLSMSSAKASRDTFATALMQMNAFHPQREAMMQQYLLAEQEVARLGGQALESQDLFLSAVEREREHERLKAMEAQRIREQVAAEARAERQVDISERQVGAIERDVATRESQAVDRANDPRREAARILLNPKASDEAKEAALTIVTGGRNLNQLPPLDQARLKIILSDATDDQKIQLLRDLGFVGVDQGFTGPITTGQAPSGAEGGGDLRSIILQQMFDAFGQ
jgi:hypothetical protein